MSYQVLYRTYRPASFDEVVGQEYIIKTLKNAIKLDKIAHAYIFAGPRGTGKTTVAKLFAKAINCEDFTEETCDQCPNCLAFKDNRHPDIIELDAASNNGVDDIREIIEQVPYAPMLGKYKIYIIDEVHMLSGSAFNALLKTLEEPPAHVIFILATTDPQKIIPTVLSRCQRYNFSKISKTNMVKKMQEILVKEKITFEQKALEEVASLAEGGMRDALSILEQLLAYNNQAILLEDVQHVFGLSSTAKKIELLKLIHTNITRAIITLEQMQHDGTDIKRLCVDLLEIIKEALIYRDGQDGSLLNKLDGGQASELIMACGAKQLLEDISSIEECLNNARVSNDLLTYFQLAILKMGNNIPDEDKVVQKEEISQEEEKIEIIKEEPTTVLSEIPAENNEPQIEEEETDDRLHYIASLLLSARKEDKISDAIIYNKLELYKYEADKRKFYELLNNTELFASGNDAIVVVGNHLQASNINSPETNQELYEFLVDEFGLDKVVFAIEEGQKQELIDTYHKLVAMDSEPAKVIKPEIVKERSNEEKLKELFDNLRVEE